MDCRLIEKDDLIEKFIAHRLDPAVQDEMELHVLSCDDCARRLEVLHAVYSNLSSRAHEIRTQVPSWPLWTRWQAVAPAALLALAMSVVTVIWILRNSYSIPVSHNSAVPASAPSVESKVAAPPPGVPPAPTQALKRSEPPPSRGTSNDEHARTEKPTSEPSEAVADLPPSPSVESAPPSTPDKSHSGVPDQRLGRASFRKELTTAQGVEWYKLGAVQAPPYTFSGISPNGKPADSVSANTLSSSGASLDAGRPEFQAAMRAYIQGRYEEAIDGLTASLRSNPKAPDANFFLGICNLLIGNPENSVAPLQTTASGNSTFVQSAHYYLAKAYIQTGKIEEAEAELNQAIAVPGRLSSEAKALLARLQRFRTEVENP